MRKNPIVDEVRAARETYAKQFGFDLDRIVRDLNEKAKLCGKATADLKSRKPTRRKRRAA